MKKTLHPLKTRTVSVLTILLFVLGFSASEFKAQVTTYSFTTAGITGQTGPTQANFNTAYASTNLNGSVVATGGIQQFTVPASGLYRFEAAGSSGGGTINSFGCRGRIVRGEMYLNAGQILKILVGQKGVTGSTSTGGGGGTYVTTNTNSVLIVGGGGAGYNGVLSSAVPTSDGNYGNAGLAAIGTGPGAGGTGGGGGSGAVSEWGGGGAGVTGNGTAGAACAGTGGTSFTNGGLGGGTCNNSYGGFGGGGGTHGNTGGGGGGGGYSGGGGSGQSSATNAGGGGGSYQAPGMTNLADLGTNTGSGYFYLTRLCNINLYVAGTNSLGAICAGNSATITTDAISSYTWSNASNASSIVVNPAVTTPYTLTAMSPSNCITSAVVTILVSNSLPTLTLTASANTVCLNNTVSITASGAIGYNWSGGITNGAAFSPSATTLYTVVGQNGCGTTTAGITITVAPLPVIGIASPTLVCAGNTSSLSGGGATTYTWQPGNLIGSNILVSPLVNTTYTVTGGSGLCIGVNTLVVTTNPNPTISTSASNSMICQGQSATLTATGGLSYTWQPGNLVGSSVVVTPLVPTAYVATGVNGFGCSVNVNQPVIVYSSPTVVVAPASPTICQGNSINLSASGADTYTWNTNSNNSSIIVSPATSTTYSVVGTNTNTGCSNLQTINVSVFVATIGITSPTAICSGSSINLIASGASSYTWTSDGSNNNSLLVSPLTTTSYTVLGNTTVGNANCAGSGVTTVTVNPLPVVTAASTRTNICKGESTSITASGANTYLWNTSATTSVISVNPLISTNYSVNGTSAANCVGSTVILIKVFNCTGINELSSSQNDFISVYPNPSNGDFSIQSVENMDLNLINELGQVVRTVTLNAENNYQATVKDLANGIYFVLSKDQHHKVNQKVVVQK